MYTLACRSQTVILIHDSTQSVMSTVAANALALYESMRKKSQQLSIITQAAGLS